MPAELAQLDGIRLEDLQATGQLSQPDGEGVHHWGPGAYDSTALVEHVQAMVANIEMELAALAVEREEDAAQSGPGFGRQ